jgi:hypothetical protein
MQLAADNGWRCSWERETPEKKKETTTVLLNENDLLWPRFRHVFIADCMEKVLALTAHPASECSTFKAVLSAMHFCSAARDRIVHCAAASSWLLSAAWERRSAVPVDLRILKLGRSYMRHADESRLSTE